MPPAYHYGGQALIEGVMMRGRDAIAVALRAPDGRILWETERLDTGIHGTRWSKLPFLRGLVVLYEQLVVGTRWLIRSASVAASEELSAVLTGLGIGHRLLNARQDSEEAAIVAAAGGQCFVSKNN